MNFNISEYPSSYLAIELQPDEKIITEKGTLVYCEGEYTFENKLEIKQVKNWIAKIFGGKSLGYNIYTAKEPTKMVLSPKDSSEIFHLSIQANNPIVFEPNLHFARTISLDIQLKKTDWKSTLNDGLKLKTMGTGDLFLKGYGKIIKQEINTEKAIYVDEEALIAFEEKLDVKTISKGIKEMVTSGEGFIYAIKGEGTIWLQTRVKSEDSSSGGFLDGIFNFVS